PMRSGARAAGALFQLAAAAVVGVGGANLARGQETLPLPKPLPAAKPADVVEPPRPSQVFPEGGFPNLPPAPEGAIPVSAVPPEPGIPQPELHSPISDYSPSGFYTREPQEGPGLPEFYLPASAPLPDYYYRPGYYETPVIGPHSVSEYAPLGYEA